MSVLKSFFHFARFNIDISKYTFSIYSLSDLGVSSNLVYYIEVIIEHYSLPKEWTCDPNTTKIAGINLHFEMSIIINPL